MFTIIKFLVPLMAFAALLGCDTAEEYTPKNFVNLAVAHTAPLKIEIAKSLAGNPGKPTPQAGPMQLPPPSGLASMQFDFGWITAGGAIVIQSTKFSVIVLQEPTLDRGKVTWSCVVHPAEAKPKLCGSDYQNSLLQNK